MADVMRVQAYRLRLYPTQAQAAQMRRHAGTSRWVYNWALSQFRQSWEVGVEMPSRFGLSRILTQKKREPRTAWLAEIQAQSQTQALIDVERSMQAFWRRCRAHERTGFPHFRRRGEHDTFRYQQGVKCDARRVYLPKIGWVRYRAGRQPEGTIKAMTLRLLAGRWHAAVFTERLVSVEPVPVAEETAVGALLGIDAIVTTDRGVQTLNPQYLERDLEKLRRASRDLSRKVKGSANFRKAKQRVQRVHERIANCRRDTLHKVSHGLVDAHSAVAMQDADFRIEPMLPVGRPRHRKMADAARGQLRAQCAYKTAWSGKSFVTVEAPQGCESSGDDQISLRSRASAVRAAGLAVLAPTGGHTPVEGAQS